MPQIRLHFLFQSESGFISKLNRSVAQVEVTDKEFFNYDFIYITK